MGNNPSQFTDDPSHPVEQVSWDDIQPFLAKLNAVSARTRSDEVRVADRGAVGIRLPCGHDDVLALWGRRGKLQEYAWFNANSGGKTHPVGQLKANGLGLVRYARQRVGMVCGLVGDGLLRGSRRRTIRAVPRRARTACFAAAAGQPREALPVGASARLLAGLPVLRPRLPAGLSSGGRVSGGRSRRHARPRAEPGRSEAAGLVPERGVVESRCSWVQGEALVALRFRDCQYRQLGNAVQVIFHSSHGRRRSRGRTEPASCGRIAWCRCRKSWCETAAGHSGASASSTFWARAAAQGQSGGRGRVDYKEVLSEDDFAVFADCARSASRLRPRKPIPVYAVCTNEQLAEMAKNRAATWPT